MQQDPLAQLKDIHLPQAIGWWPPAPGWWIVTFLLLASILGLIYWIWRRHRKMAYRRAAVNQLEQIKAGYQQHRDPIKLLTELSVLLKRTCITRYGRDHSAGLTGQEWLQFLDSTGNTKGFTEGCGKALVEQRYQAKPDVDCPALLELVKSWLQKQS